jgi:hypothetical protein
LKKKIGDENKIEVKIKEEFENLLKIKNLEFEKIKLELKNQLMKMIKN